MIKEATPRKVIKEAFTVGILDDAQVWIDMLQHRNQLAHKYDIKIVTEALQKVSVCYFSAFTRLHAFFLTRSATA